MPPLPPLPLLPSLPPPDFPLPAPVLPLAALPVSVLLLVDRVVPLSVVLLLPAVAAEADALDVVELDDLVSRFFSASPDDLAVATAASLAWVEELVPLAASGLPVPSSPAEASPAASWEVLPAPADDVDVPPPLPRRRERRDDEPRSCRSLPAGAQWSLHRHRLLRRRALAVHPDLVIACSSVASLFEIVMIDIGLFRVPALATAAASAAGVAPDATTGTRNPSVPASVANR